VAGAGATLVAAAVLGVASLLQRGVPFPPLALAQQLQRLIPGGLAVWSIELLGHWALRGFVAGILFATLAAGAGLGVAVARAAPARRRWAAWGAGVLVGLVTAAGYLSAPRRPSTAVILAVAAVSALAWVSVASRALDRLERDPVPVPARGLGRTRREFLRAAAGAAALLTAGFAVGRLAGGLGDPGGKPLVRPAGARLQRPAAPEAEPAAVAAAFAIPGLTPEVTANRDHYTVDESIIDPDVDAEGWRLRVDGLVSRPLELTYRELLGLPAIEQLVTMQCISNLVGGDLVGTARWTGVPLRDVLARAGGVPPGAVRVVFHATGGYTDSLPVDKALERSTIVAYGMNNTSLPRRHGYPARIIVPGIYGMKNVKWLERIEVVDYEYEGYWQRRGGWDNVARVKTASRIDVPAEGADPRGELTVAGVAWAGERGIRRVEVSADGGGTWSPGVLRRALAPLAWRQWRLALRPPAGQLRLRVRAVDGTGALQAEAPAPPHPGGAAGYHEVHVRLLPD
jgi:DMSO/TMAO reductase YedYZ molybdopterin-dependent catalytic subunit